MSEVIVKEEIIKETSVADNTALECQNSSNEQISDLNLTLPPIPVHSPSILSHSHDFITKQPEVIKTY